MNRPEDIPERVWEEALEHAMVVFDASVDLYEVGTSGADPQLVIARAILAAEKRVREECAQIAENDKAPYHGTPKSIARETAVSIAAAIRKGGEDASQHPMNPTTSAGTGVHGARWQLVPTDQDKGGGDA